MTSWWVHRRSMHTHEIPGKNGNCIGTSQLRCLFHSNSIGGKKCQFFSYDEMCWNHWNHPFYWKASEHLLVSFNTFAGNPTGMVAPTRVSFPTNGITGKLNTAETASGELLLPVNDHCLSGDGRCNSKKAKEMTFIPCNPSQRLHTSPGNASDHRNGMWSEANRLLWWNCRRNSCRNPLDNIPLVHS